MGVVYAAAKRKIQFFDILLKFCVSNSQGLSNKNFVDFALKFDTTSNPSKQGNRILTLSGKTLSPEKCFHHLTGGGIGLDLILCNDYVKLGKYLYGKWVMDLSISMWKEDLNKTVFMDELLKDYPEWFIRNVMGKVGTAEWLNSIIEGRQN